jgi:hypothetical protein
LNCTKIIGLTNLKFIKIKFTTNISLLPSSEQPFGLKGYKSNTVLQVCIALTGVIQIQKYINLISKKLAL